MIDLIEIFKRFEEQAIDGIAGCIQDRMRLHRVVNPNPREDHITCDLIGFLCDAENGRGIFFQNNNFHIEEWVIEKNPGDGLYRRVARMDFVIDFEISSDSKNKEERNKFSLVFEAKKLNIPNSNTSEYVENGVCRFVTKKYSAKQPMGCMLGYVMDGKINGLQADIVNKLKTKNINYDPKFKKGPIPLLPKVNNTERFETTHEREGQSGEITIRHTLLDCG